MWRDGGRGVRGCWLLLGKGLSKQDAHCLARLYGTVRSDFHKAALKITPNFLYRPENGLSLQVVPDIKMGPNVRPIWF